MQITPAAMTSVTFVLLDALVDRLIDKGVLDQQDQLAMFQRARESLANSTDQTMREAVALLDHLYKV